MPVTGLSNKRPPYVIFIQGTPRAFRNLEVKDPNTLYFISEKDSNRGTLYLGDKVICSSLSSITKLADLSDMLLSENIPIDSMLIYDGEHWVDKTVSQALAELIAGFQGATETEPGSAGLVPAPAAGQQNYFLKGDGTWSEIDQSKAYYDTVEGWDRKKTLISEKGAVYVYSNYQITDKGEKIPGIKVGDGTSQLIDMPFITDRYEQHINNTEIHITQQERENWNDKVTCFMSTKKDGLLVFTKEDLLNG